MVNLHGNSSLPRSGSELMQGLLSQHPDVYASATSPLLEYWYGALGLYDIPERKSQNPILMKEAFKSFCREGAKGYYSKLTTKPTVVDKSRGWLEYGELLWGAFPDAKIICMLRSVDGIIGSLERLYRENIGHPETRQIPKTSDERAKYWLTSGSKPLGLALDRLNTRRKLGEDPRILYVNYEDLCKNPIEIMRMVFSHIGLKSIDIDRNNVTKGAPEDDSYYGIFGNHQLKPTI